MRWPRRRSEPRTKAAAIAAIRETFAWFGYPLDALTDDEIEVGVAEGARLIAASGVSAREATEGLHAIARAGFSASELRAL